MGGFLLPVFLIKLLDLLVESTGNNFILLGAGQLDEVDSVAADPDGQLGILLRMFLGIRQDLFSLFSGPCCIQGNGSGNTAACNFGHQ